MMTIVNQNTIAPWSAVMRDRAVLAGPSAGSRSGLPAAPASSRCSGTARGCPGCPVARFAAKSLSPTTTMRDSGFGASASVDAGAVGGGRRPTRRRRSRRDRPCRPWPVSSSGRPVANRPLMSDSAQLCGLVSGTSARCGRRRRRRPASPIARAGRPSSRRSRSVIGCCTGIAMGTDASVPSSWPEAAGVDDDVLADVDAPVVREGDEVRRVGRRALVGRVEQQQHLAAASSG